MEPLEIHIDRVITTQSKLQTVILFLAISLMGLVVLLIFFDNSSADILTKASILFCFSITVLLVSLFLIFRLHACMNKCHFIKFEIQQGNVINAIDSMKETVCTKEIDAAKIKSLVVGNLNNIGGYNEGS